MYFVIHMASFDKAFLLRWLWQLDLKHFSTLHNQVILSFPALKISWWLSFNNTSVGNCSILLISFSFDILVQRCVNTYTIENRNWHLISSESGGHSTPNKGNIMCPIQQRYVCTARILGKERWSTLKTTFL